MGRKLFSAVVMVLLSEFAASHTQVRDCEMLARWSYGPCESVSISGSNAFIGNGGAFSILDISDYSKPIKTGEIAFPGFITTSEVAGDYAYISSYSYEDKAVYSLYVINVSDVASPYEEGSLNINDNIRKIVVYGEYAYTVGNKGLHIIDISDAVNPVETSLFAITITGSAQDVQVSGGFAFVADRKQGLRIIDVTNPDNPVEVGSYDTGSQTEDLFVVGNYVYMMGMGTIQIIDVSDANQPVWIGQYDGMEGNPQTFYVKDNYVYLPTYYGLDIVDLSSPDNPIEAGSVEIEKGTSTDMVIVDHHAFIAARYNGLIMLDVYDPMAPTQIGQYRTSNIVSDLFVTGDQAYCANDMGLEIIDVSDPSNLREQGYYHTDDAALGVRISNGLAFIACRGAGLYVLDISDAVDPGVLSHLEMDGDLRDIWQNEQYVYVADYDYGLRIIDVANPMYPVEIGSCVSEYNINDIFIKDTCAYLATSNDLVIVNVRDPMNPKAIGFYNTLILYCVAVQDHFAYCGQGTDILIINIDDPSNPRFAGSVNAGGIVEGFYIYENYLYVSVGALGVRIYDLNDPFLHAETTDLLDVYGYTQDVFAVDGKIYVGDIYGGFYIYKFDPEDENIFNPPRDFQLFHNYTLTHNNEFRLSWQIPDKAGCMATLSGYCVYRNFEPAITLPPDSLSYFEIDPPFFEDGSTYYYLTAIYTDPEGESLPTDTLFHEHAIGIEEDISGVPVRFSLDQNYPNPFNTTTSIAYTIPQTTHIILSVYDINGRLVETLVNQTQVPGKYSIEWGIFSLGSGVYFYRLQTEAFTQTRKMLLIK